MINKPGRAPIHPHHHVQFYNADQLLIGVVARFVRDGLVTGDTVVVIATPEHTHKFITELKNEGLQIDRYVAGGVLILKDAQETLGTFLVNRLPDPELFQRHIGGLIEKTCKERQNVTVRAFAEMVDLLLRQGNAEAALRLEELWNEFATRHEFSLLCAYTMGNFTGTAHSRKFESICRQHARVRPTDRYVNVQGDAAQLREVSFLQQRARSLESEIERRKAVEANLREMVVREQAARAEAENSGRMKDEFLAVLSHELRTPLNAILGWAQIIEARNDPGTVLRALDVIKRNAKLQLNLINDLLDISRIISGKMIVKTEPVNLAQLLRASLDTVRPAAMTKGVEIEMKMKEPAPVIAGDADRLQQVVWNLLTNAIKFTRKGGKVELCLEHHDSEVEIVVRDTGAGIDPEFLPYVFDRFRQADNGTTRRMGGLGLGLAVVRYLVEAHGGSVSAESPGVGLGATFTVRLPIEVAVDLTPPRRVGEETSTLQGCRILVVDDERDTCDLFRYILEDSGAEVGVAQSADEALALLLSQPFDLILADIGMPGKDGFAMISAIRAHSSSHIRNVRAIAVTSYAVEHFRTRALTAGFDDYIMKPIQPTNLTKLVADHLTGRVA